MEQHWSTVCALLLALSAFVHYDVDAQGHLNFRQKPGVCPDSRTGPRVRPCPYSCFNDNSCPGVEKCCYGCGSKCKTPKEKSGRCPVIDGPSTCADICTNDWQCSGTKKCCKTCGTDCFDPV